MLTAIDVWFLTVIRCEKVALAVTSNKCQRYCKRKEDTRKESRKAIWKYPSKEQTSGVKQKQISISPNPKYIKSRKVYVKRLLSCKRYCQVQHLLPLKVKKKPVDYIPLLIFLIFCMLLISYV